MVIPKLDKGKEYKVELYPQDEKVKGKYIGENNGIHVFRNEHDYFFVNNHWMTKINGVITHKSTSSFLVRKFQRLDSDVVNILKKLGEL